MAYLHTGGWNGYTYRETVSAWCSFTLDTCPKGVGAMARKLDHVEDVPEPELLMTPNQRDIASVWACPLAIWKRFS